MVVGSRLIFLCRKSSEGGGGDIQKDYKHAGRWAGDRIVVIGDYDSSKLYQKARTCFQEISKEIIGEWNDFIELDRLKFGGDVLAARNKQKEGEAKIPSKPNYADFEAGWLDKFARDAWLEQCELR